MSALEGILRHENTVLKRIVQQQGGVIKAVRKDIQRYKVGVDDKGFEPAKIVLDVDKTLANHQISLVPLVSELNGVNNVLKHRATEKGQRQITSLIFDRPLVLEDREG